MAVMMKEFIDRFANMEKIANETLAADPAALVGVDSMPGSEHDAKVPADAKKPDEEVTQGQPAGATTAEGAVNGGDTKPLNEGKLEVDQPLENPDKKPLITDDALTAKEASSKIDKLVGELLDTMKTQKEAQCGGGGSKPKTEAKPAKASTPAAPAKKEEGKGGEKKADTHTLELDEGTLSKIAAATATYMAGRNAAEKMLAKQASDKAKAVALIKQACIKAAQESGLDPAAAAAAADNAMAAAGMDAGAADAAMADAAADAAAADAGADAAAADAGAAADVQLPEDVTEEELGEAIVDLVQSGELDVDTAKALVDEIAGDAGGDAGAGEGISEDQAAEIIAQGLESGEITPEQAKEIVDAIESGAAGEAAAAADAGAAADAAGAADAEAAGAADAAAAIQDAQDEMQGAADAEAAMKQAAADIRQNAINKVASAIVTKRAQVQTGSPLMNKVASVLLKHKEALDAKAKESEKQASAKPEDQKYIEGFCKKAAEMGVDPKALAQYVCANKDKYVQAAK